MRNSNAAELSSRYENLQTEKYLGELRVEVEIPRPETFTEGPAVDRAGRVFFVNIPTEEILRWDPNEKALGVFRKDSHKANGLLFDRQGNLLACEGGAGRMTRTDMQSGKIEILAHEFNGFPFSPPNDLALDRKGRIYFTSRPSPGDPPSRNLNAVYRIDPDGTVTQLLKVPEVQMPNGIVTSPDDKILYVIEAHPDAGHNRHIRAYDLKPDGNVENPRVLIDFYPGRSGDGMCMDAEGNLYVAAGLHRPRNTSETLDTRPGIHVISPTGKLLAFVRTPEDTITNCRFGGEDLRTLYITCGSKLLSLRTRIPGKALYRPSR